MLKDIVNNCYDSAVEKQKADGYTVLERGLATIPYCPRQGRTPTTLRLRYAPPSHLRGSRSVWREVPEVAPHHSQDLARPI
jgi:hypothetical protein